MRSSICTRKHAVVCVVLSWTIWNAPLSAGAHFGGFIIQLQDGRLVIGQDAETPGGQPNWNTRAVGSLFAPEQYSDLPSFLSLANPPTGTQAIPPLTSLYWDFLPMTVSGYTSNLLYWNGQGAVNFGPVPIPSGATDVTIGVYNTTDNTQALVSDSSDMVAGALLGVTNSSPTGLRLHRHNYYLLDDGDGVAPTNVAEGVYLLALQMDSPGYGATKPIFVVPGTYGLVSTSLSTLETAVAWVEENAASLIRDGDYDFDGDVDQSDYMTWKAQFGSTGPFPINGDYADGNRDGIIDAADFVFWRENQPARSGAAGILGDNAIISAEITAGTIPEPSSLAIIGWAAVGIVYSCNRSWKNPRAFFNRG
jgi:hypothetical protein